MRKAVFGLAFLMLLACREEPEVSNTVSRWEAWPTAEDIAKIRKEDPGITDYCLEELRKGTTRHIPAELCFKFGKPRHFKGKWLAFFEGSRFCAEGQPCDPLEGSQTWLGFAERMNIDLEKYRGGIYEIEFRGRQTIHPGPYGHMGAFDQEVLVDRLISIKELKPPPKGKE